MDKKPVFKQYFQRLAEVAASGDAREESFYSAPESLLEQVAEATGRKQAHVTTLPKKTEAGNPDFRLWNGKDRIVGYIEAKKPTEENLNQIEDSDQLRRYRSPNHAKDNEYLFSQALRYSPEWVNKPASELTLEEVGKWAEKWAADLQARKKSRVTVNKALVALQSAWNCPRGSRRAPREYPFNPFSHVERFSIERPAKILPTDKQARAVLKAAEGEGRVYLEVLKGTGARPGEGRLLKWEDVNIDQKPYSVTLYTQRRGTGPGPREES